MIIQKRNDEKRVRVLRPDNPGVSFVRAFNIAKEKKLIIISNKKADELLMDDKWDLKLEVGRIGRFESINPGAFHTGTMTAYVKPGTPLGKTVEYTPKNKEFTWIFIVPLEFVRLRNTLLAVEHPNYDLEVDPKRKRIIVTPQKKLTIPITCFATHAQWHETDPATQIPINKQSDSIYTEARLAERIEKRVGPIDRYKDREILRNRVIGLYANPAESMGVLVD